MSDIFKSGRYATAVVGGPGSGSGTGSGELCGLMQWTISSPIGFATFINNKTGGHVARDPTFNDASGTLRFDADQGTNNPLATASNAIKPGLAFTNLCLYRSQSTAEAFDGQYWQISSGFFGELRETNEISMTGKPILEIAWVANSGTTTPPGGTAY